MDKKVVQDDEDLFYKFANDITGFHECEVITIPMIFTTYFNSGKWTLMSKHFYAYGLNYCPYCGTKLESGE